MKRFSALLLALVMCMGITNCAFAADKNSQEQQLDAIMNAGEFAELSPDEFDAAVLAIVEDSFESYTVEYSQDSIFTGKSFSDDRLERHTVTYLSNPIQRMNGEFGAVSVHTFYKKGSVVGKVYIGGWFEYDRDRNYHYARSYRLDPYSYVPSFSAYESSSVSMQHGNPASIRVSYKANCDNLTYKTYSAQITARNGYPEYSDASYDI